ncbi:MAG: Putative response regulator, partial [uncultured Nocardioides sp.]
EHLPGRPRRRGPQAAQGPRLQRRRHHAPAGHPGARSPSPPRPPRGRVRRGRHRARGHLEHGRRRRRPGDPRRGGRPGRWPGHRQAAQGRDLPVPAGRRAHRPAAGRVARDLVACRGDGAAPDRPGAARRGRHRAAAPAAHLDHGARHHL